jgi:NhaP-type Na+/H+ or K+/H+ antiporter
MITVVGLLMGIFSDHLGKLGDAVKSWGNIDAHLILLIFIPALIFESSFSLDWHIFKMEFS